MSVNISTTIRHLAIAYLENADADMENAEMENADKRIKTSSVVDGLPCNRFGLPDKTPVSFKY